MFNFFRKRKVPKSRGFRYHFFVSYTTREDEVKILKPFLDAYGEEIAKRLGFPPIFYDGWTLRTVQYSAVALKEELSRAIWESAFTVCFLSPSYFKSDWCLFEWGETKLAHGTRGIPAPEKSILPIVWKSLEPYLTPPKLDNIQVVNIVDKINQTRSTGAYREAVEECADATLDYINAWFPKESTPQSDARIYH